MSAYGYSSTGYLGDVPYSTYTDYATVPSYATETAEDTGGTTAYAYPIETLI